MTHLDNDWEREPTPLDDILDAPVSDYVVVCPGCGVRNYTVPSPDPTWTCPDYPGCQEVFDQPVTTTTESVLLDRFGSLLEDMLETNRHLTSSLRALTEYLAEQHGGEQQLSSLAIEDMQKGSPKITSKSYGEPLSFEQIRAALDAHGFAHREAERRSMDGWAATLEEIERAARPGA